MFDCDTDSADLRRCLEGFIQRWYGSHSSSLGISADKLAQTQLPKPLTWLYGYAGAWPGAYYWDTILGNQDCLLPFEDLFIRDGKLIFVVENQAVWHVGTESSGDDPPVWVSIDQGPWHLVDESLTRFLVTFVLHETLFGFTHVVSVDNVLEHLRAANMHVSPLWCDRPYPFPDEEEPTEQQSFHLANGKYLILNNAWCATNEDTPWLVLPSVFKPAPEPSLSERWDHDVLIPEHLNVPSFMRQVHLETVILRHEAEAQYHLERCKLYRQMLAEMQDEED